MLTGWTPSWGWRSNRRQRERIKFFDLMRPKPKVWIRSCSFLMWKSELVCFWILTCCRVGNNKSEIWMKWEILESEFCQTNIANWQRVKKSNQIGIQLLLNLKTADKTYEVEQWTPTLTTFICLGSNSKRFWHNISHVWIRCLRQSQASFIVHKYRCHF